MAANTAESEVIIVGGGIAGLATAIALRQRGVEAVVLEQTPGLLEMQQALPWDYQAGTEGSTISPAA